MRNVIIQGTGIYIPENKVYNEQMDAHFEKEDLVLIVLWNIWEDESDILFQQMKMQLR